MVRIWVISLRSFGKTSNQLRQVAAWWDSTHSSRRAVVTLSKTDGQQEQHHLYRQQNGFHIEFCIQTIFISSYIQLFSQSWCFVLGFALPLWLVSFLFSGHVPVASNDIQWNDRSHQPWFSLWVINIHQVSEYVGSSDPHVSTEFRSVTCFNGLGKREHLNRKP